MNKLAQKIELVSHIAIIIVAALISIVLVKTYLLPDSKTKSNAGNSTGTASNTSEAGIVGKAISLPDTNWEKNGRTLVLALSMGCRYCNESAEFYKQLAQQREKQGNFQLIAVLPQSLDDGRKYLNDLGIAVDAVKQLTPSSIGVRGTPTLLLVNKDGVVTDSWIGKLPPPKETEVFNRLNLASR
jgi:thioredoxin-related protein